MRCVVTAGPTFEPLDQVRRLTNFSTGRLGSELVNFLSERGHEVVLLIGQQATYRGQRHAHQVETFTTTANLRDRLKALAEAGIGAVFHAAAVSDFTFGKVWLRSQEGELIRVKSAKISSRQGTVLAELVPTPKIIAEMRGWFPQARLVGWKYEAEGDCTSTILAAEQQIAECHTDACVVNGPAYGAGFGLVRGPGLFAHCGGAQELFHTLEAFISAR